MRNIVNRLEDRLGVDLVYLTKNGIFSLAGQLVAIISGLVLSIMFANFLSKEVFGQYQYLIALSGILSAITLPGMNTALIRGSAHGKNGIYHLCVNTIFKYATIVSLGIFIYSGFIILSGGHSGYGITVFILGLLFPFFSVINSWRAYYAGKEDFKTINIISSLTLIVQVIIQTVIVIYLPRYQYLFLAYILSTIVVNLPISLKTYRQTAGHTVDIHDIKYGYKLSAALSFALIATYIDRLVLGHFLGVEKLAIYSIAILIPEQAKQLYSNLLLVHYPKFFNIKNADLTKIKLLKLLTVLFFITCGFIMLYIAISPILFKLIFSRYQESLIFSQIYIITAIFTPMVLLELLLRAERNTKEVFIFNIMVNTTAVGASVIFIPTYGLWGVIAARYFSLVTSNLYLFYRFKSHILSNKT